MMWPDKRPTIEAVMSKSIARVAAGYLNVHNERRVLRRGKQRGPSTLTVTDVIRVMKETGDINYWGDRFHIESVRNSMREVWELLEAMDS